MLLPLPDVSRRHCRIVHNGEKWEIIDLESLNGVWVNDRGVERAVLNHGDRIRLGVLYFHGRFIDAELARPTAPTRASCVAFSASCRRLTMLRNGREDGPHEGLATPDGRRYHVGMTTGVVLEREEYIEQAYFFRVLHATVWRTAWPRRTCCSASTRGNPFHDAPTLRHPVPVWRN